MSEATALPIRVTLEVCASLLITALSGCPRNGSYCDLRSVEEADIHTVPGQYTIMIIKQSEMIKLLGSDWQNQTLFYSVDRILDESGEPRMVRGGMSPLAKGSSVFLLSGGPWEHVSCAIYSLDTRRMLILGINTKVPRINVRAPLQPKAGSPVVMEDGTLVFR